MGGNHATPTFLLMDSPINLVKVFSVTKVKDRDAIGDHVTAWLAAHPGVRPVRTIVALSSDQKFHCLSIVLLCSTD